MKKRIRLLPGMKFMLGGVLYRPGDILDENEDTRALVKRKEAEWVEEEEESASDDSYEAKNLKALFELAKERDIEIPKGTNKAGLIELLKAHDAGVS